MKHAFAALSVLALIVLLSACARENVFNLPPDRPVIDSINPASGVVGTQLRLYGSGFSTNSSANRVTINGVAVIVDSPSTSTVLLVHLADSTGTGKVNITVQDKKADGPIFTYLGGSTPPGNGTPEIVSIVRGWNDGRGYVITVKNLPANNASVHFEVNGVAVPVDEIVRSTDPAAPGLLRFKQDPSLEGNGDNNQITVLVFGDGVKGQPIPYQIPPRNIGLGKDQYHPGDTIIIAGEFFGPRIAVSQVTVTYGGVTLSPALSIITWTNQLITAKLPTYASIVADNGENGRAKVKLGLQVGALHADTPPFWYLLPTAAVTGTVTTIAGSATSGYADGQGTAAVFSSPRGIVADAQGNIYVADAHRIRKVTPNGTVSTYAGTGEYGYRDGQANTAQFKFVNHLAIDPQGNLYTSEFSNHCIRKITPAGVVSTFAGDTASGYKDGIGHAARFYAIYGLASDANGTIYAIEQGNLRIRKITSDGTVTTYAGNGDQGHTDGPGATASFGVMIGLAIDKAGNLYATESYPGNRIRKIAPGGIVSTLAGGDVAGYVDGPGAVARFNASYGVATDNDNNVYVADGSNNRIRKIAPDGTVTTLAGNGQTFIKDGTLLEASFKFPSGLTSDAQGNLYVADEFRIRKITLH